MSSQSWLRRALALAAVLITLSCSALTESGCTLIGCENVLTVAFTSPPDIAYHVEALSIDQGSKTFDCSDPSHCQAARLDSYAPDMVVITVTDARGSKQYNLTPSYVAEYPNGKRCGAACRTGTVTVALP